MAVVESPRIEHVASPFTGVEPRTDLVAGVELHPAVASWFEDRFADGPTAPQRGGWPHLAAGRSTLIAAPTGSGKTLAGFLMCINDLYLRHAAGRSTEGARVVYVSPLKALAVDIAQNLEDPLRGIAAVAAAMGLDAPALSIGVRTGDTTPAERASMVRNPPTFVVTTPESLYLLVTAERSRGVLRGVETVIVDEIHALARDKRGAHLCLTLERLAHVCDRRPVRVGLSATQKPIETVARLLVGSRSRPDGSPEVAIVDSGHQREWDLALEIPAGELEAVTSGSQMAGVLDRIAELVEGRRTTLVFVNTRRMAERLAHQLGERLGEDVVAAHHGSLSRERRQRVESRLRAGDLRALVATASLELGIDVGPVELVCQIGSPRSIATFLQRVGRSNHTRAGIPTGRLFPLTRDELVESAALLAAVRGGRLDEVVPPVAPLDILAQQVVAETAAEQWSTSELYELVRRAYHYRSLSRESFDEVVELVAKGVATGRGTRAAYVHHDAVNGELRGRKGARLAALTSGGAIPELGDLRVVLEPDETFIGTVNEDWATESMAGDVFLLGTHSWQIRRIVGGQVRVVDADGKPPTIPFWFGEAPARTVELSAEVSALRAEVDRFLVAADPEGAKAWVRDTAGLDADAAGAMVDYLAAGRAALGLLPTQDRLVLERFFDESGGMQLVVHSPWGGRINRAMGYALRKKFCRSFNFELQASADDDTVVISLGPHHSFALSDVPRFLNESNIRDTLTQAVLDQPIFLSRWRWNLNRSLIVLRFKGGRRNPPPIQRMEADDLMAALFPGAAACQENITGPIEVPDHPVVRQTVHDALTEGLDVDGLCELWHRIAEGTVEFHYRDTTEPSLLAHEILTARPYAFLDEGEVQDRRTNAVPLSRGIPVDPSELARLQPAAIEQVREEVTPRPATADELHDLLAMLVLSKARPEWEALFGELESRNRVGRVAACGNLPERWHTVEAGAAVHVLLEDRPDGGIEPESVAADIVRGHLELHSPVTAEALAALTGLKPSKVAIGLAELEASGFALQGRYTSDGSGDTPGGSGDTPGGPGETPGGSGETEWCSRRLLARMHAYSRRSRRRALEPLTPEQLVRFWLRWQHVAPGSQLRGRSGLESVIAQMQGASVAVAAWEPEVLARRVIDYDPRWLDELTLGGTVIWGRLNPPLQADPNRRGSAPSKVTPVTLAFRDDLAWLSIALRGGEPPGGPEAGAVAEVVEALGEHGALFAGELATHTARMPAELEEALWDAVARGLVTSDGFAAIRALSRGRHREQHQRTGVSRLRRGARTQGRAAGRWSLLQTGDGRTGIDLDELAEAWADQMLTRWGVVFYDIAAHEGAAVRWRDIQWALRRMEDRGLVRGGRFVNGFSGEQFALPAAIEGLKQIRRAEPDGRTLTLNAVDPLNVTGVILPGARVPSRRTGSFELPL